MSASIGQPIPAEWRAAVVKVLRSGDKSKIQSTKESRFDWDATFPNSYPYQRWEAMAQALATDGICGNYIADMVPPCKAYEFWFVFDERQLYGKIGLLPSGDLIIIFSSHIPRKGEEL